MKTERLYYEDAYIKEFSATVISSEQDGDVYRTVVDRSAFFPEAGGQKADTGTLGDARVIDVIEEGDILVHITDKPLAVGECVEGVLDFDLRLEKMRHHTAEHILCGIMHRLFGVANTGFHLGDDEVTFDVSQPLTHSQLDEAERLANAAVRANLPVITYFPTAAELPTLTYRSKLELEENVRIVNIGDIDSCACCAPHVAYTGEIGMIKLVTAVKHRGGSRITMLAGSAAYEYVTRVFGQAHAVSHALCAPVTDLSSALVLLMENGEGTRRTLSAVRRELAAALAASVPQTQGSFVVFTNSLDEEGKRLLLSLAGDRVGGTLAVISGEEGAYRYVLSSSLGGAEFRSLVSDANAALSGKGGGKPPMAQGTFCATLDEIKKYFS